MSTEGINVTALTDLAERFDRVSKAELALVPNNGRGKLLCDFLRQVLNVPEGSQAFTVRFALHEPIAVNCDYLPGRPPNKAA